MNEDELKVALMNMRDELELLKVNETHWRYAHDEIEAACGGEMALTVRHKVLLRRYDILYGKEGKEKA